MNATDAYFDNLTRVLETARRTQAESGIGNVELVAEAPGSALRNFGSFKADVSGAELRLDKSSDRAAFDKPRHGEAGFSERRRHVQHVGFGTGCLHQKLVAVVHGHPVGRRDAHAHAGHAGQRIFDIALHHEFHIRFPPMILIGCFHYTAAQHKGILLPLLQTLPILRYNRNER